MLIIRGIIRYVTFNGRKAIVRQSEIELLQKVGNDEETQIDIASDLFEKEEKVSIISGPFIGYISRFSASLY